MARNRQEGTGSVVRGGEVARRSSRTEDALGFVERLHARNGTYPNLEELAVKVTGTLPPQGDRKSGLSTRQIFLEKVIKLYADQSAIKDREQELAGLATQRVGRRAGIRTEVRSFHGRAACGNGDQVSGRRSELRGHFERMHTRFQRIRIGVVEACFDESRRQAVHECGDRRVRLLTQVPCSMSSGRMGDAAISFTGHRRMGADGSGRSIRFYPRFRRRPGRVWWSSFV